MKIKIVSRIIITFCLLLLCSLIYLLLLNDYQFTSYVPINRPATPNEEIIFISDTQLPIFLEKLWLDENNNEEVRGKIFNEIIDAEPLAVFHFGDLVALGFYENDWKPIDDFVIQLYSKGITFNPTLGNHEEMFFPELGEANFIERFPFYSKTGYSIIIDSIAVIMLNSNFGNLSQNEITRQQYWYLNKLNELDTNRAINLIVVGCHHSPFTNSTIVDSSEVVQKLFVPNFINTKKAKLFVSGHAHAFEHFKFKRKDFIVIGGGGGLQQPLLVGKEAVRKDEYDTTNTIRRFHYVKMTKEINKYVFKIFMINEIQSQFKNVYEIDIRFD